MAQLGHLQAVFGHGLLDQGADGRRFPIDALDAGNEVGQGRLGFLAEVLGQQFGVGMDVDVEHLGPHPPAHSGYAPVPCRGR